MANISAYMQKNFLDWCLGGAAATQPANRWAALANGTPTSVSGSEISSTILFSRQTALFGAAASPAGSASNTASILFGPFSSAMSVIGVTLWDGSPINSSNILWYGTLQTNRTVIVGDQLVFNPGALLITLS